MRLAELQQAIRQADPAAVLVPPRVLERLLQALYQLSGLFEQVPHRKVFVIDRPTLYRHVEQDELDLEPDRLLPATVILLARPSPNTLAAEEDETILTAYWRRLFHAGVHRAMQQDVADGRLTPAGVRERVEAIGASAFAEIRMVLDQEKALLPRGADASETDVYIEFAAVYLELRYFAANLLPIYFPGLADDRARIDALLERDVDAAQLFARTRLAGAPEPKVRTDTASDESHDYYWRLMGAADKAEHAGNTVRAAILRTKAARVAPAALEGPTHEKAHNDLRRLTRRLQAALELTDAQADEWLQDLPSLLDKADQGSWPVEAALLFDLQKVGVDHERDIYALDLVTWLVSGGRLPIKRPLPSQRLVRITKHLRSAAQRLTQARLADDERQHLARLLRSALDGCEERLRSRFRPVLGDALVSVGLQPGNPPERTAFARMIEEMLDRIAELGFLTFSDLRDTISRNQLKMPDLHDPQEFVRGDPLVRLDRRLARALDGVYRPAEIYLSVLERLTAPAFGTALGRWLMLWLLLPFGGAAVMVQGAEVLYEHFRPHPDAAQPTFSGEIAAAAPPSAAPAGAAPARDEQKDVRPPPAEPEADPAPPNETTGPPPDDRLWGVLSEERAVKLLTSFLLGLFLLALLHVEAFRRFCKQAVVLTYRALHGLLIDLPLYVARLPLVRQALTSWPFQLSWSFLLKPAAVCAVFFSLLPPWALPTWPAKLITFVLVDLVLNSRFGKAVGEAVIQSLANFYELLRAGLLPGLLRLLLWAFKQTIDTMEYVLHTVDEWLRFRQGDSQLSLVVRTVVGLLWYPVAWVARFYLVVLIEPGFNPIKAPVSYLAAKFMVPVVKPLTEGLVHPLEPLLGPILAWMIAVPTVWLLPDLFGFLFWETKENWRLYRANRQKELRPVGVGSHGETVRQLLQPGFHSGTVPKLYARLREAEREAIRTGSWRAARACRHQLAEVEQRVRRLFERELVKLLQESTRWESEPLRVGEVVLTPTRIGVELVQPESARPVRLEWEDQAGWLVAAVREPGWLEALGAEPRQAVTTALVGLYKLAGIDLVRETVRAVLPPPAADFTLTPRDLVVEVGPHCEPAVYYDLTRPKGLLRPRTLDGGPAPDWPPLDPRKVIFARVPLTWQQWVESWQGTPDGRTPRTLVLTGTSLLPAGAVAPPAAVTNGEAAAHVYSSGSSSGSSAAEASNNASASSPSGIRKSP